MTRWAVFSLINIFADLSKHGIDSPSALIRFPWDGDVTDDDELPTDKEVKETIEMLRELNRKAGSKVNP